CYCLINECIFFSGVAVLSCTDCSGSSTASSDITDPGSPFSTASNHSEDSGSSQQATRMPPAQSAHHPPWPWTAEEGSSVKRSLDDKPMFTKRQKVNDESAKKQSPTCLNPSVNKKAPKSIIAVDSSPTNNNNNDINYTIHQKLEVVPKMQQGKITEYFKTQVKANAIRKELLKIKAVGANRIAVINQISNTAKNGWRANAAAKKTEFAKSRKLSTATVPRKILPAPSKLHDQLPTSSAMHTGMHQFTPTVTLTALSFPPNLTYLHTKAPKPPDSIFVPQFATISNDKVSTIPVINRNPCLNVIQPVQKIATLNNFNCVKLNATVVPIVNLNALPSRLNGTTNIANVTLSVDTAVPTVLPARPKVPEGSSCFSTATPTLGKYSHSNPDISSMIVSSGKHCRTESTRTEEPYRTEECQTHQEHQPQEPPDDKCWSDGSQIRISNQKPPSPTDSDSGISSLGSLEINVDEQIIEEPKKSPILSQPKTIRFPAAQHKKDKNDGRELGKSTTQSIAGRCRWDECAAQFDTSGALLEHLQVKHVISQSQANREQYVCLWRGCKVHGRRSCSISWLERHVLAHAGTKPFRCIVDGCGQRFNSQLMLERHVNNHFNSDGTQSSSAKKSLENGPVKLFKRNGRIIRFRRQPWSARMFDFFDGGIMEGLQYKLMCMTQARTLGQISGHGELIHLQNQIVARRTDSVGNRELLVRWHPVDVTPDEWISEKEYKPTKALRIPTLSTTSREALNPILFPSSQRQSGQKHRRKPLKFT
uniref:C2H2-type domain-containing protein n=1 Tax=Dendroctonus ponderosae TaxID=77166 RepID=A0AAR5QAB1_DENPD